MVIGKAVKATRRQTPNTESRRVVVPNGRYA